MPYKKLFIWVEGPDDIRFFETVIQPIMENEYDYVEVFPYAEMPQKLRKAFMKTHRSEKADIVLIGDINSSPCITHKKVTLKQPLSLQDDQVVVVIQEIESWYLAGLTKRGMTKKSISTTDDITKEDFNSLIPVKYDSRTEYMIEILKSYSIDQARKKNKSFDYFASKFLSA